MGAIGKRKGNNKIIRRLNKNINNMKMIKWSEEQELKVVHWILYAVLLIFLIRNVLI